MFCYIDESGTPDIPGNTSHYVLIGLAIPVENWKECDKSIEVIKLRYGLADQEIHTAWVLRKYPEQNKISNFDALSYQQRRTQVKSLRIAELLRLQRIQNKNTYRQARKNFQHTDAFIHLSFKERRELIIDIAKEISNWTFARLFAECVDKIHFDPLRAKKSVDEQAFEQVVSRFEQYLQIKSLNIKQNLFGLLIHDNNPTVAKKHTLLMKKYHQTGTLWTNLKHLIETPLFVDSELTSMIQIADLCSYAMRRYLENGEFELFDFVYKRADRKDNWVVGVRHYTNIKCNCKICIAHKRAEIKPLFPLHN